LSEVKFHPLLIVELKTIKTISAVWVATLRWVFLKGCLMLFLELAHELLAKMSFSELAALYVDNHVMYKVK